MHEVYDSGAAAKDGRLLPGDQILEVLVYAWQSILCTLMMSFAVFGMVYIPRSRLNVEYTQ